MLLVLFLPAWLEQSGKWYEMRLLLKYTSIQEDDLENKLPAATALRILNPPLRHHFNPSHNCHPHSQRQLDAAVCLHTRLAPDPQALCHKWLARPPHYQCLQFNWPTPVTHSAGPPSIFDWSLQ